ncbi:hypothetical protein [Ornithinimicrobium cryptoxanthini]|uniref:hypothetical protein n=1 Tax=Ornithinimicrobium cryptoxanthini TaxID=2934161 RepID=UPI0021181963|nr:hypothetical protein [Ornithinimicrobium cryptoxanthini]
MQELFKEAAKIAAVVPEAMQEAAFHRALDMLTAGEQLEHKTTPRGPKKRPTSGSDAGASFDDRVARVSAIARNDAAEIDQETSVQGRSMALLVVAKREADVDGLTAPEIAKILTEKFRHRTSRQAVQQAMDAAGNMIDRQRNGNSAAVYRVMKAGDEWLMMPADQRSASGGGRSRSRRRPPAKEGAAPPPARATRVGRATGGVKRAASAKKAPGNGRRVGPKAALEALIDAGYFAEPRSIADIRQHIRDQKAISFENSDLSPALTRLLREEKLRRTKPENQYVYTAG